MGDPHRDAGGPAFTASHDPVCDDGYTLVSVRDASLGQLQDGNIVYAVGYAGPDGTLSARAVAAVSQLPPGRNVGASPSGRTRDCSPSSIAVALSFGA